MFVITKKELKKDIKKLIKNIDASSNSTSLIYKNYYSDNGIKLSNAYYLLSNYVKDYYVDDKSISTNEPVIMLTQSGVSYISGMYYYSCICIDRNSPLYLSSIEATILIDGPEYSHYIIVINSKDHYSGRNKTKDADHVLSPREIIIEFIKESKDSNKGGK